eukprot:CAMPEP_0170738772 /NCGR_PEP_ID=MMETSP0437-20130122/4818_1 /TAXON_ID=0 /ORGANISM="Sexangularia sp." /LENGTH=429 /DNA_ID=CAMNT_0011077207 /DNA_START=50 /DNA_END=1339 /DNA_ORIENTATION=-
MRVSKVLKDLLRQVPKSEASEARRRRLLRPSSSVTSTATRLPTASLLTDFTDTLPVTLGQFIVALGESGALHGSVTPVRVLELARVPGAFLSLPPVLLRTSTITSLSTGLLSPNGRPPAAGTDDFQLKVLQDVATALQLQPPSVQRHTSLAAALSIAKGHPTAAPAVAGDTQTLALWHLEDPADVVPGLRLLRRTLPPSATLLTVGTPLALAQLHNAVTVEPSLRTLGPCPHAKSCPVAAETGETCSLSLSLPGASGGSPLTLSPEGQVVRRRRPRSPRASGWTKHKFAWMYTTLGDDAAAASAGLAFDPLCVVVRPPIRRSRHVTLDLCTGAGTLERRTVGRRGARRYEQDVGAGDDEGAAEEISGSPSLYRCARSAVAGDRIGPQSALAVAAGVATSVKLGRDRAGGRTSEVQAAGGATRSTPRSTR